LVAQRTTMSKKANPSKWLKSANNDDSSSDSDEEAPKKTVTKAPAKGKTVPSKWAKNTESSGSDSEEDVPKKGSATKAPPQTKAPAKPQPKASKWMKGAKGSDSDSEEEQPKKTQKPAPVKGVPSKWAKKAESSDEESEDDFDESESDESEGEKKDAPKKGGWFKATRDVSDSEEESAEEDEEDEEKPVKPKAPESATAKKPINKWMKGEDQSDESESEDEVESSDEEDKPQKKPTKKRFTDSSDDEGSSDEEKRIVRSHKEKRLDEMKKMIEKINDMIQESEWKAITEDLTSLFKIVEKLKKLPEIKETPKAYIRFISNFEDEVDKAQSVKKKMTPTNAKALGSIKGKIRKHNAEYKQQIAIFKKDPDAYIDEEDVVEKDESESDEEATEQPVDEWQTQNKKPKNKYLLADQPTKKAEKKPNEPKALKQPKIKTVKPTAPEPKEIKWTDDLIEQKLNELKSDIGYRGTNPIEQINELKTLLNHVKTDSKVLQVLVIMISSQFSMSNNTEYMPTDNWKGCISNAERAMHIIETNKSLSVLEADEVTEDANNKEQEPKNDKIVKISGSFAIIFERLDDEFTKSLQHIDPHTQDYVNRLRDEVILLDLGERIYSFYKGSNSAKASSIALRFMEHLHHRRQEDHVKLLKNQREQATNQLAEISKSWVAVAENKEQTKGSTATESTPLPSKTVEIAQPNVIKEDLSSFMEELVTLVYKYSDLRSKTKAVLLHMYNLSLQGKFYQARDMLLMSRLQDTISGYDVNTQVLFNRAITQLGLCAFRNGLISEAHDALVDICSSQRVTLLAQSNVRFADKTKKVEVDRLEKQRRIPFHRHINIDMLEGVHLISAMLLEVPNMAQNTYNNVKKKVISKAFRRLLDFYDRQQVYAGPPENTRDYINVAARALSTGDWKKCYDTLLNMEDLWLSMIDSDSIKSMLLGKIKTEALRTYILQYSRHYDTISIQSLANMFDLSTQSVHSIVSRMMINEELHAAWDQPTQSIQLFHAEPSKLQYLALQLAERATNFVEYNERLYDAKSQGGSLIAPSKEQKERSAAHRAQQSGQVQRKTTGDRQTGSQQTGDQKKVTTTQGATYRKGASKTTQPSGAPQKRPTTQTQQTTRVK
jgi:translation initiation factor 3 subunit C